MGRVAQTAAFKNGTDDAASSMEAISALLQLSHTLSSNSSKGEPTRRKMLLAKRSAHVR